MGKLLFAGIIIAGLGMFFLPATIHAQSDQYPPAVSQIEQPNEDSPQAKSVFYVKVKDALHSLFGRMKSLVSGKGGSLEGNEHSGSFEGEVALGTIKGHYRRVSDTEVEITILCKPALVPYRAIEAKIRESLS